ALFGVAGRLAVAGIGAASGNGFAAVAHAGSVAVGTVSVRCPEVAGWRRGGRNPAEAMKRDNINYVLVGVVVAAALGLLLATLTAITGRGGEASEYHAYYDNVTGLSFGAPVFYEGFRIGQVDAIEPDRREGHTRYRVDFSVREDWEIPEDSVAQLVSQGLLADVSIGIREGQSPSMLEPGSEIAAQGGADLFVAMNELAGELTVLTRERIRPLVDTLATRLDSISGTLDENLPGI